MTNPPPYRLARVETTTTIVVSDPPALEPVNAGTVRNPRPSQTHTVTIRTINGEPHILSVEGRRILKRDKGDKATGARTYQSFGLATDAVRAAWGEVDPPRWINELYDAWRSGNLVDGRNAL